MNQPQRSIPAVLLKPVAVLRIAGIFVLGVFLATCTNDAPSGPSSPPVLGTLAFTPVYPSGGSFVGANLTIDHLHVIVVRPPSTVVKDTTTTFDANIDQLKFKIPVLLRATAESLDVTLELLSGTQVPWCSPRGAKQIGQSLETKARSAFSVQSPPPPRGALSLGE
jgi:hypothetical protein